MDNTLKDSVEKEYWAVRREQIKKHRDGEEPTDFDNKMTKAIATASSKAVQEVRDSRKNVAFNVVTAPTGAGKSTGSAAYAIASRKVDPNFTAAFIVKTTQQCQEVYDSLLAITHDDMKSDIVVWSGAHDSKTRDEQKLKKFKFVGKPQYRAEDLKSAPIIVVTHNKWLSEVEKDTDNGIRKCDGFPRDLVYIDENPDLVSLVERVPSDIGSLKDFVIRVDPKHVWVSILTDIQRRMEETFDTAEGTTYSSEELVTPIEGSWFNEGELRRLLGEFKSRMSDSERAGLKATVTFIVAAAAGYVFFTRQKPRSFVAYITTFRPAPGYVLLDATADLSGLVAIMPGMDRVEVPQVNYQNLGIRLLESPDEFRSLSLVTDTISNAKPYVEWMREKVLESTKIGDDVLIVAHKRVVTDFELIRKSPDGVDGIDWEGRNITSLHWGTGVGSNNYKHIKHVFLFSEFYQPRRVTAGHTLGLEGKKATSADFSKLQGQKMSGNFLTLAEGDLLRWTKQLACRGNVRNADANGVCGDMTLHTSMDMARLFDNLERLFPGADVPEVVLLKSEDGKPSVISVLSSRDTPSEISFADFAELTGIPKGKVRSRIETKKVSPVLRAFGWSVCSAKELGRSGKEKYLARFRLQLAA